MNQTKKKSKLIQCNENDGMNYILQTSCCFDDILLIMGGDFYFLNPTVTLCRF